MLCVNCPVDRFVIFTVIFFKSEAMKKRLFHSSNSKMLLWPLHTEAC